MQATSRIKEIAQLLHRSATSATVGALAPDFGEVTFKHGLLGEGGDVICKQMLEVIAEVGASRDSGEITPRLREIVTGRKAVRELYQKFSRFTNHIQRINNTMHRWQSMMPPALPAAKKKIFIQDEAEITADLMSLDNSFNDVMFGPGTGWDFGPNTVSVVMKESVIMHCKDDDESRDFGPMRIWLVPEQIENRLRGDGTACFITPVRAYTNDGYFHPHVSRNVLCEGEGLSMNSAALKQGRVADFFSMIELILKEYNGGSPHHSLRYWPANVHSGPCSCGREELGARRNCQIRSCRRKVCDRCQLNCGSCGNRMCMHHRVATYGMPRETWESRNQHRRVPTNAYWYCVDCAATLGARPGSRRVDPIPVPDFRRVDPLPEPVAAEPPAAESAPEPPRRRPSRRRRESSTRPLVSTLTGEPVTPSQRTTRAMEPRRRSSSRTGVSQTLSMDGSVINRTEEPEQTNDEASNSDQQTSRWPGWDNGGRWRDEHGRWAEAPEGAQRPVQNESDGAEEEAIRIAAPSSVQVGSWRHAGINYNASTWGGGWSASGTSR